MEATVTPPTGAKTLRLEQRFGPVKSALRALLVIEELTKEPGGLTFVEIAERLSLPKSSTHALLQTMRERRHLRLDGDGRYRIGLRVWQAGQACSQAFDLARLATPFLRAARDELHETVQLAVLDGIENVYLAKEDPDRLLVLRSRVGARLPAYATGLGKALLAGLSDEEVLGRLGDEPMQRFTASTLSQPAALLSALEEARRQGYSTDHGEYTEGVVCVAVPVRSSGGQVAAAISVSAPTIRADGGFERRAAQILAREAAGLSIALGYEDGKR